MHLRLQFISQRISSSLYIWKCIFVYRSCLDIVKGDLKSTLRVLYSLFTKYKNLKWNSSLIIWLKNRIQWSGLFIAWSLPFCQTCCVAVLQTLSFIIRTIEWPRKYKGSNFVHAMLTSTEFFSSRVGDEKKVSCNTPIIDYVVVVAVLSVKCFKTHIRVLIQMN